MRVCIVAEGCYPFVVGGVSSWVHSLIQLFDRHDPVINTVRGLSLSLLDSIGPLRRAFAGHLVFGVGV